MRRVLLAVCAWAAAVSAGCSATKRPAAELPDLGAIIAAHDARVGALDSFWARASVRVEGRDAEGSRFAEQGEGHVQVERPDKVAVTVGKLGEVYFALGSNEDRYWLIDVSDADRRVMVSGAQSAATPEKAGMLGLPVHPRDIPLLIGLMRMEGRDLGDPEFDARGRVRVGVATRWGPGALFFDARSLELVGSAAYGKDGVLLASAELSRYADAMDALGVGAIGRVPSKIEMRVPGFDGFVRMELGEPRARDINATVFNPERLARAYRVGERIDLDEQSEE